MFAKINQLPLEYFLNYYDTKVKHIYKLPFTALGPRQESYLKTNKKLIRKKTLTPRTGR
jgi:hypothetical protein